MKLLEAEAYSQTLSLNVHIAVLNVSRTFTGKGNRATALYESSAQPLLASICLHYDRLGSVVVCQGSIEEGLADPGFEALEGCIHQRIPIPFGKLSL